MFLKPNFARKFSGLSNKALVALGVVALAQLLRFMHTELFLLCLEKGQSSNFFRYSMLNWIRSSWMILQIIIDDIPTNFLVIP